MKPAIFQEDESRDISLMETATLGSLRGRALAVQPLQKSLSLPSYAKPNGEGIDHRVIFAALEQKEKKKHRSRIIKDKQGGTRHSYFCLPLSSTRHCRETSLSSDTSCSSVEFQRPKNHNTLTNTKRNFVMQSKSAEVINNEPSCRDKSLLALANDRNKSSDLSKNTFGSSDSLERPERSSRSSTDSLSRKERIEAVKARVEAEREKYVNSSSDEEKNSNIPRYHSDGVIHRTVKEVKTKSARAEKCIRRRSQDDVALRRTSQKQQMNLHTNHPGHQSLWKPPVGNTNSVPQAKDSDGVREKIKAFTLDSKTDSSTSKNVHGMEKQKNCNDFSEKENLSVFSQFKSNRNTYKSQQRKYVDDTIPEKQTLDLKQKVLFYHKTNSLTKQIAKNNLCAVHTVEPEESVSQKHNYDLESSATNHLQDSDITCMMQNSNFPCAPVPPPRSPQSMMFINKKYFNIKTPSFSSEAYNRLQESHSLERNYPSYSRLSYVGCVSPKLEESYPELGNKSLHSKMSLYALRPEHANEGKHKMSYGKDSYNVFPIFKSATQKQTTTHASDEKLHTDFSFPLIAQNSNKSSRVIMSDCSVPLLSNEAKFSHNPLGDGELKLVNKELLKEEDKTSKNLKDYEFRRNLHLCCQSNRKLLYGCNNNLNNKLSNSDHYAEITTRYTGDRNEPQEMEEITSADYKSINLTSKLQTSLYPNRPKPILLKKCERLSKSEVNLSGHLEERLICSKNKSNVILSLLDHPISPIRSKEANNNKEIGKSKELSEDMNFEVMELQNGSDNLDSAMKELENVYHSLKLSSENLSDKSIQEKSLDSLTESLRETISSTVADNTKQIGSKCCEPHTFSSELGYFAQHNTSSAENNQVPREMEESKKAVSRRKQGTHNSQSLCIDDLFHHLTQQLDLEQKLFREEREKSLLPCSKAKRSGKEIKLSSTSVSYLSNDKQPSIALLTHSDDSQSCSRKNVLNVTNPLVANNAISRIKPSNLSRRKYKATRSLSANLSYLVHENTIADAEEKKLDLERPQSAIFASFTRDGNSDEELSQSVADCTSEMLVKGKNNEELKNFEVQIQPHNITELKSPFSQDSKMGENSPLPSKTSDKSRRKSSGDSDEIWQVRVAMDCNETNSSHLRDLSKPRAYSRLHSVFCKSTSNTCAYGRKGNWISAFPAALTTSPQNNDAKTITGAPIDEIELERLLTSLLSDISNVPCSQSPQDSVAHLTKSRVKETDELMKDLSENVNNKRSSYVLKMDQYLLSRSVVNHEKVAEDNFQEISEQQRNDVEKLDNDPNQNYNENINLSYKADFYSAKDSLSLSSEKEVKALDELKCDSSENSSINLTAASFPQFLHSPSLSCSKNCNDKYAIRKRYARRHSVGTEDFSTSAVLGVNFPRCLADTRSQNVEHLPYSSPKLPGSKPQNSCSGKSELTSANSFNDRCGCNNFKTQAETILSDSFKDELSSQNIQTTSADCGSKNLISNWNSSPTLQSVEKLKDKSFKRKSSLNRYDFIQISQPTENVLHQMQNYKQTIEHGMSYEKYSNLRLLSPPVYDISAVPQMKRNSCPFSKFDETNMIKTSEAFLEKNKNKDSRISKSDTYCRKSHQNSLRLKNMKADYDALKYSQKKYCSAGEQECFTDQNENENRKFSLSAEEQNSKDRNRDNFFLKNDNQILNNDDLLLESTSETCTNHTKSESKVFELQVHSIENDGKQCLTIQKTSQKECSTSSVDGYDKQCDYHSTLACGAIKLTTNHTDVEINQYTNNDNILTVDNTEYGTKHNSCVNFDSSREVEIENKHESQTVNIPSNISYDQILTFKSKCDVTLLKSSNTSHNDEELIKPMSEMSCLAVSSHESKSALEDMISGTNIIMDETESHSETEKEILKLPNSILRKAYSEDRKELHSILKRTADDKLSRQPHSILKHRGSSEEKDNSSQLDLHSILKKSSSEEESSSGNTDIHPILKNTSTDDESNPTVKPKPILKKRTSFNEEYSYVCYPEGELKPILKKKTVADLAEEQPKPILKTRRKSEEAGSTASKINFGSRPRANSADLGIKSILKKQFDEVEINSAVKYLLSEKQDQNKS